MKNRLIILFEKYGAFMVPFLFMGLLACVSVLFIIIIDSSVSEVTFSEDVWGSLELKRAQGVEIEYSPADSLHTAEYSFDSYRLQYSKIWGMTIWYNDTIIYEDRGWKAWIDEGTWREDFTLALESIE